MFLHQSGKSIAAAAEIFLSAAESKSMCRGLKFIKKPIHVLFTAYYAGRHFSAGGSI